MPNSGNAISAIVQPQSMGQGPEQLEDVRDHRTTGGHKARNLVRKNSFFCNESQFNTEMVIYRQRVELDGVDAASRVFESGVLFAFMRADLRLIDKTDESPTDLGLTTAGG
jgi:hypothetical protein